MQIVTSFLAQGSGQPAVLAKPGKDGAVDTFAGLLAALSGVTGLLSQVVIPDPATVTPDGVPPSGLPASSQPGAGASLDPFGQTTGLLAFGPSIQADTPAGAACAQAATAEDGSASSGPLAVGGQPGAAVAGAPSADQEAAPPAAGQLVQAGPAPAAASAAAAQTPLPLPGSGQVPSGPAIVPDSAMAQAVAAPSAASGPAAAGAPAQVTPAQVTPSQAIPSNNGGYQGTQKSGSGVGAVVTGGVAAPGSQPAASKVDAGPVSAQAATSTQQQAAPAGANPQLQTVGGYPAGAGTAEATQAVFTAPVHSPVQDQATPGAMAPAPAGQTVQGSVNSGQAELAQDRGGGSSGGKGTDPGKTLINPPAGNPVPVVQASTATPVVSAASLPHDTAQNILSYLNQGGRLPAQLQLQLDPPALGKMTVHLAMEAGTLAVTFVTASSHARDAVAASLPQMRELLGQNNFVLGHTGVYVGSQAGGQGNTGGNHRGEPAVSPGIPQVPEAGEERIQTESGSSSLNILV